jgi:hypothetical protein
MFQWMHVSLQYQITKRMKNILLPLTLLMLLASGQATAQSTSVTASVTGNSVTLYESAVVRNCGSMYDMHVYLQHDTLFWYQVDTGATAVCLCTFSFSVTVDSLAPGSYIAMVYDVTCPDCPPPAPDTVFEGSTTFVITEPLAQQAMYMASQYQSDCTPYSSLDENQLTSRFTVINGPAGGTVRITTTGTGTMTIRLIDLRGVLHTTIRTQAPTVECNTNGLPSGIYILECRQGESVEYFKLAR